MVEIALGDVGQLGVEFDADDLAEGKFAGDEHGAAFAGADVEEGVAVDGVGWDGLAPVVDEGAEDAGGDAVVGGDVGVVGVAGDEVAGGDEAAGVDAVGQVEGMDGTGGELEEVLGPLGAWVAWACQRIWTRLGLPSRPRVRRPAGVMLLRGPGGMVEEDDFGVADGFEAGEAVDDLGAGAGLRRLRLVWVGVRVDFDAVFLGDAGDVGAGGFGVGGDGDGVDEAEVDYVAGEGGVVAVAQGGEDVGFGEHLF